MDLNLLFTCVHLPSKLINMNTFSLVPEDFLKEIKSNQEKIIALISKEDQSTDYVTEKQAREIFKRKSTWFWQMRKKNLLPFTKVGKTIYYSKTDIKKTFENNKNTK